MAIADIRIELLDSIYETALAPEKWGRTLDDLAAELGADLFQLVGWDEHGQSDILGIREGAARCGGEGRYRSYHRETPTVHRLPSRTGDTTIFTWKRNFCDGFRPIESHCQHFLCSDETPYSMSGPVLRSGSAHFEIAFLRCHDQPPFSADAHDTFNAVCPHLRRTLQLNLNRGLSTAEWAMRVIQTALDTTGLGVAAFDGNEQLCYVNGRGKALLNVGGFQQSDGRLKGHRDALECPLGETLRKARESEQAIYKSLLIGNVKLCVTALPIPHDGLLALGKKPIAVVLLMTEAERQRIATARQLIQFFGLTPAETRLARALAQGESINTYAQAEGVGLPTVRAQLRKVFAKTGTDRQGSLVKLLTAIPVVRT